MASGTILGTTGNEYIDSKIEWSSVADATTNTSKVTAALYYKRNNTGYTTYGTGSFAIYIGGYSTWVEKSVTITESAWVKVVEATETIKHKDNGSQTVLLQGMGHISGTSLTSTKCMETVTLDTIPRASTIDSLSCSSQYFTGTLTYKYTPKTASYYNRCAIRFSNTTIKTINLGQKSASQQTSTVTLTESELSTIYNKLPSGTGGYLSVVLYTYADSGYSQQIGSAESKSISLSIPNDATTQPTVSMSLAPSSTLSSPYNSLYIQGISKVKATLTPTAKYGASVVASSITVDGKSYASPYESEAITQSGTITVKATAKDSRGYYGTNYKDIEVIPYNRPYVRAKSGESSIVVARCDASASFTNDDTSQLKYLKIKAKIVYSDVNKNNHAYIKYRYREEGGEYKDWQTILDCKEQKSDEVITGPLLGGELKVSANYQVQLIAVDDFYQSDPITFAVPSDAVYMDRPKGGKSMGLGGYVPSKDISSNVLDVYWKTRARGGLSMFSKGDEIPLDSTLPLPRGQVAEGWNPDSLANGIYVVANNVGVPSGNGGLLFRNGVLIQMHGDTGGGVMVQLAIPVDEKYNGVDCIPMYRIKWYASWSNWRSFKL